MENEILNISDELLDNISVDNLTDLKIEVDEINAKLDDIISRCNSALNS